MPLSACTRSSSVGSRHRPCYPPPRPQPCCSGRCSPQARSPCARSMDGRASPSRPQRSRLTSPPDRTTLPALEITLSQFPPHPRRHPSSNAKNGLGKPRMLTPDAALEIAKKEIDSYLVAESNKEAFSRVNTRIVDGL